MDDPLLGDQQEQQQQQHGLIAFLRAHSKTVFVALGPLSAIAILSLVRMEQASATRMLAALVWVCSWWVTEALPVAITSLMPLLLLPALELGDANGVAMSYMNDTITIFIGSFILAVAVEKYKVHSRLALKLLLVVGGSTMEPRLLLLGFCAGPAFVSMWISNTAAAIMMIPMSIGVLHKLESGHVAYIQSRALCPTCGAEDMERFGSAKTDLEQPALPPPAEAPAPAEMSSSTSPSHTLKPKLSKPPSFFSRDINIQLLMAEEDIAKEVAHVADFGRAVVMGIAFSVSIGGMATLTGTSTNMILSGIWSREFPSAPPVTYSQWFLLGFPLAVTMLIFCWLLLSCRYCPAAAIPTISHSLKRSSIQDDYDALGPVTFAETTVLGLFMVLIMLWLTRKIGTTWGWGQLFDGDVGDGTVSILAATLLFIIPNKEAPGEKLMDWSSCKKLPWDIVLLLGGGFALAQGISTSGLSAWVTRNMAFLHSAPYFLVTPVVALFVSIMTEFTSNNATATIFLPLLANIALSIGIHPLFLMLTGTITASYAFMLPIATPPNAIAFTTNYLKIMDTITNGLLLKLFGIVVISLLMPTLGNLVFGLDQPFTG